MYGYFSKKKDSRDPDLISVYLNKINNQLHVDHITNDDYRIISREPLVVLSMYGAIFGFRKIYFGAAHFLICDAK